MKRDIKQFVDELADYINRFIAGRDGSYIKRCRQERLQLNRGHAIPLEVRVPEEYHGRFSNLGPTFYAEELLEEFPNATVACIAENINVRMNEHYPEFLRIMKMSAQMEDNSIEDYKDDIIISTLPIQEFSDMNGEETDFIIKRLDNIGITMSIKGCLFDSQLDKSRSFFVPILKKNGREVTEDDWKRAEANCLRYAEIHIAAIPANEPEDAGESEVVYGTAVDANKFYDYFYLVSPKSVWDVICMNTGAKKVYIAPDGAYQAVFVADNPKADNDVMAAILDEMFFDEEEERQSSLPVLVYDYETSTLKKFEREGWHL